MTKAIRRLLDAVVICFIFAFLFGCSEQPQPTPKTTVQQIAEAPDGTILWQAKVFCGARCYTIVYFSSAGTQYTERHGKTTKTIEVPNACR